MAKHRVQLFNQSRGVEVDTDATPGATVGVDLFWPDGAVVSAQALSAAMQAGAAPPGGGATVYWRTIMEVPPNVTALQNTETAGLYVLTGPGGSATRTLTTNTLSLQNASGVAGDPVVDLGELEDAGTGALLAVERDQYGRVAGTKPATITGVEGEVTVEHGDAVGGLPTVGLADVPDEGGGALQRFQRDGKGRVSGTSEATTDDLPEGAGNWYFTDERADSRVQLLADQLGTAAYTASSDYATAAQGEAADTALQPGANVSTLTNDAGYVDAAGAASAAPIQSIVAGANVSIDVTDPANPVVSADGGGDVESVNGQTGAVVLDAGDVGADPAGAAASAVSAHEAAPDPHPQYTTASEAAAAAPVQSVNGKQGAVVLEADDVGAWTAAQASAANLGVATLTSESDLNPLIGGPFKLIRVWPTTQNQPGAIQASGMFFPSTDSSGGAGAMFIVRASATVPAAYYRGGLTGVWGPWMKVASTSDNMAPDADNSFSLGAASTRWNQVYATTGTINTSDAREKTEPRDLTEAELAAAADIARLPCIFQWLHAIEEKGEDARLHASPTVQAVIAAMEAHGLDPFRYGFVCFDQWNEQPEILDEWPDEHDDEGNLIREAGSEVTQEYRPAGDRYSLRPTELAHFVLRGLAHRQDELERRLAALEG